MVAGCCNIFQVSGCFFTTWNVKHMLRPKESAKILFWSNSATVFSEDAAFLSKDRISYSYRRFYLNVKSLILFQFYAFCWCSCSLVLVTLVTLFASHYFADENLGLEMYFTQVFPWNRPSRWKGSSTTMLPVRAPSTCIINMLVQDVFFFLRITSQRQKKPWSPEPLHTFHQNL